MKIDAHQHFWQLANPFTDWPTPDLERIHRDFTPADLEGRLAALGIGGTVLVQAAPHIDETAYCLDIAERASFGFDAAMAAFKTRQPMGRIGDAQEIAALALYLASDAASLTTGQCHVIDGGWSNS